MHLQMLVAPFQPLHFFLQAGLAFGCRLGLLQLALQLLPFLNNLSEPH